MIELVQKYNQFVRELPHIIANSDFKAQYFMRILAMKPATYYRKLREHSFTLEEVELLAKALYPKETLLLELEDSLKDRKTGDLISHKDAMKQLRQKYL